MRLTIAKPAMAAFEGDLKSSLDALNYVKARMGFSGNEYKVNNNLVLETGLQVIVREKDLADMGRLERNIAALGEIPISIHAPYNYDGPATWHIADLSEGDEGFDNLMKVVKFGDNIGAHSIAVHPNAIREKSFLESPDYTREMREKYLNSVFNHVLAARDRARTVSVDLENKPFPSTTADNENIMYGTAFAPFRDIARYFDLNGKITFDTCHYGITMRTINDTIKELGGKVTDARLRERNILGYFAEDFTQQPEIHQTLWGLGKAVNHIHLNDGSVYRPHDNTGMPDKTRPLPKIGGSQLWWEAYVPGRGELCDNSVIMPWLRKVRTDNRKVTLTVEVTEFDRNYAESPRFREAAISLVNDILSEGF